MSDTSSGGVDDQHWVFQRLPSLDLIRERLRRVFPEGVDYRTWAIAERAARSLYVFLYALAIEGVSEQRLRPAMLTTMSDEQAGRTSAHERIRWWEAARKPRRPGDAAFQRYIWDLAWGSFAWFASEPGNVLVLYEDARFDPQSTLDSLTR